MIVLVGMVAMEFLGLLALTGLSLVGVGTPPWVFPHVVALPVGFAIGFVFTYALGRALGVINLRQIDTYRDRVDTMSAMARSARRGAAPERIIRRRAVIEY